MIEFNSFSGLEWSWMYVADFWSVGFYYIHIKKTMLDKLGWIESNKDKIWFNVLKRAVLNLIWQYTVIAINLTNHNVYLIYFQDILRIVQTFGFNDFLYTLRNRLIIRQSASNLFSANLMVNMDYYFDPFRLPILPSTSPLLSWKSIFSSTTCACGKFIMTATNNEVSYIVAAIVKEKQLMTDLTWETTELICYEKLAP